LIFDRIYLASATLCNQIAMHAFVRSGHFVMCEASAHMCASPPTAPPSLYLTDDNRFAEIGTHGHQRIRTYTFPDVVQPRGLSGADLPGSSHEFLW
jgi:hypothetical protein